MLRDKNGNELRKHNMYKKVLDVEFETNSTSYTDIPDTSYDFVTNGGTVRIQISANIVATNGYSSFLGVSIDGHIYDVILNCFRLTTESRINLPQSTGIIYVNLSAGRHTLKLKTCISNSSSSVLISKYSTIYIDVLDV